MLPAVKLKPSWWPALLFVAVFALTRVPGVLPLNFSAAYAFAFCAGVYFSGRMAWWLPIGTLVVTDLGLNSYYQFALGIDAFQPYQLLNYVAFSALIGLGRVFRSRSSSWLWLLGGGVVGAVLFYLITNTAAWFFNPFGNPEYTKDFSGWIIALTKGTGGYPETWTFFRNTLLSGGLFTGLFAGAMQLSGSPAPEEEEEAKPAAEDEVPKPEESKA
jgi:hypothetical protein